MAHLSFAPLAPKRYGGMLAVAVGIFALGFASGAIVKPGQLRRAESIDTVSAISRDAEQSVPTANANLPRFNTLLAYPAEVIRIIDGDTFEARVRVWPGLDVDTKVRLRGIDAAELHARCSGELAQAQAARTALEAILADGGVAVSRIGIDKYGGRVDAAVATRNTADVSAALLNGGFARAYGGGKRGSWCG